MLILELTKPGAFLKCEDPEFSRQVTNSINFMVNAFFEANIALNLFIQSKNLESLKLDNWIEEREVDRGRRQEIEEQVKSELSEKSDMNFLDLNFKIQVRYNHEKWEKGIMPVDFENRLGILHAKSFVSALDTFGVFLKKISKIPSAPLNIKVLHSSFTKIIPDLKDVRDSTQHIDERVEGKKYGKEIELKPFNNGVINSEVGSLALWVLTGNKFGITKGNGELGEVEISIETLSKVQPIMQETFNSFEWIGPKKHLPN